MEYEDFEAYAEQAVQALAAYRKSCQSEAGKVIALRPLEELRSHLGLDDVFEGATYDPVAFRNFLDRYLAASTKLHRAEFMAHQVAVPAFASSIADLINGFTNNGMAIFEMGPPAVAIELAVMRFLCAKVGWKDLELAGGVLTHGGALANLTALLAARRHAQPNVLSEGLDGRWVLLAPESSHYSIMRCATIMGMGTSRIELIPVDSFGRLRVDCVEPLIKKLEESGKKIMAVCANACATVTGLYDNISAIGEICQRHGIWFHVDGAHGASALMHADTRELMRGAHFADSLIWDGHKMLGSSTLCAAVLLKNAQQLDQAFREDVSYLGSDEEMGQDLIHRSVECTKAPLGLKLFLNFAIHGVEAIANQVAELYAKGKSFYKIIEASPDFSCPHEPETNILCFRYEESGLTQSEIRQRLMMDGDYYITEGEIQGQGYLRLSIMNPTTEVDHLNGLLNKIRQLAGNQ